MRNTVCCQWKLINVYLLYSNYKITQLSDCRFCGNMPTRKIVHFDTIRSAKQPVQFNAKVTRQNQTLFFCFLTGLRVGLLLSTGDLLFSRGFLFFLLPAEDLDVVPDITSLLSSLSTTRGGDLDFRRCLLSDDLGF